MSDEKLYRRGIWYSRFGMLFAAITGAMTGNETWFLFSLLFIVIMGFNHLGLWLLKEKEKADEEG